MGDTWEQIFMIHVWSYSIAEYSEHERILTSSAKKYTAMYVHLD